MSWNRLAKWIVGAAALVSGLAAIHALGLDVARVFDIIKTIMETEQ